jgi:H+/Cl- antiporter ClcA
VTDTATPAQDPADILRSKNFVVVLVFAAAVGIVVSLVGWAFLEVVHKIQVWVFTDLPSGLGFDSVPSWWGVPVCALAGVPVAFTIARLPGAGGHVPANGLQAGGTEPNMLPGIVLAALATLGLGIVLGPEAPLLAIGSGVAVWCVQRAKRDAPPTLLLVIGAAGAFAAISVLFGSPIIGAILIIEATGLGGATLPLILIPGLVAAGIGSLVFIGMTNWTGLPTSAYSLAPLQLAALGTPTLAEIGWAIAIGFAAAIITYPVRGIGLRTVKLVTARVWIVAPIVGCAVGALAFVFQQVSDKPANLVLFSGQDALPRVIGSASTFSVGTLLFLLLFKGVAWGISLGSFRGGPTFPAMFLGAVGGIAASHLPGLPMSAAVPVGMGAMIVAFLRLPLSAVLISIVLCASAGSGVDPLIIVGVVVSYIATLALEGRLGPPAASKTSTSPPRH